MKRPLVLSLSLALASLVAAQASDYPVFESDKLPAAEYKARRQRLMQQMGPNSVGVFFTNPEQVRNNDVDFMFRGDSDFLYLTGFEEPDAALVLVPGGVVINGKRTDEVLFCNVTDQMSLTWLGYRMGPANAMKLLGLTHAEQNTRFEGLLAKIASDANATKLFTTQNVAGAGGQRANMIAAFNSWRQGLSLQNQSAEAALSRMREIKSPEEIRILRHVINASSRGHIEAMKATRPEMWEYQVAAIVKYVFEVNGCESTGYPPIVGSGPNSTILHYNTNRRQMKAGDIVCMDTAGEYRGYSADITRSFPVSGKFSPEQRAIYEVVLAATDAGIAACKVGASRGSVDSAINKVLGDGLTRLGVISNPGELRRYYMHGWGHGIGLDVHDPWPADTFQPGMVFTVEPGIYIKEGSPCDRKWWNIGVRIEDDVLITQGGPENLSASCPRTVEEVERTMAQGTVFPDK
jgi:Xaa-Pro aminopeptidase